MRFHWIVGVLALAIVPALARAAVTVTIDAPGQQTSLVGGVTTETFDGFALGNYNTLVTAVGTLTDTSPGAFGIEAADQYGGAGGTGKYMAVGAQSGSGAPASLALNTGATTYFGFWLSALDAENVIRVYSGATLLTTIDQATITGLVGGNSAYNGNPNSAFLGQNGSQPYTYVNITGTAGTTFDSIVFYNSGSTGTGLELDNFSVLASSPVPLPSAAVSGIVGLLLMAGCAVTLRRRQVC